MKILYQIHLSPLLSKKNSISVMDKWLFDGEKCIQNIPYVYIDFIQEVCEWINVTLHQN